jgi:6-phosphogluconolactonase
MAQLTVADDEEQLAALAAERVTQLILETVAARGKAFVSLAGGTTPRRLYSNLADPQQPWRIRIPWPQVHLFWGDERHVPPDHPDSNYGMAKAALLDHVPMPPGHVHRIRGEMPDAREAAADYEAVVSGFPGHHSSKSEGGSRTFDVTLLGLGEDAHIASIFPGSELLADTGLPSVGRPFTGRRAAAVWVPQLHVWRITLTPGAILESDRILVLVAGRNKATAVHAALDAPLDTSTSPAQLLRAAGDRVAWFLDRPAASRL